MPELDSLILRDLVCVLWLLLLLSPASSASWSSRRSRNLCSRINCTFCDRCFLSRSSRLRMKHLALFRRPSVVWRLESEPRGTSSFSRSKQPLRWALLWVTCPVSQKLQPFLGGTRFPAPAHPACPATMTPTCSTTCTRATNYSLHQHSLHMTMAAAHTIVPPPITHPLHPLLLQVSPPTPPPSPATSFSWH